MERRLLIATRNHGKFLELREVLAELPVEILSLGDLGVAGDFDEGQATYEENALGKAQFFYEKTGVLTVADDSGIEVDAFPAELGVMTRRWGGDGASDQEWIAYFLERMASVPENARGARFVCCASLYGLFGDSRVSEIFRGETRGIITSGLEAPLVAGIPLSSCFRPEGFEKVYSALDGHEKNSISHRGKAVHKLKERLLDLFVG